MISHMYRVKSAAAYYFYAVQTFTCVNDSCGAGHSYTKHEKQTMKLIAHMKLPNF